MILDMLESAVDKLEQRNRRRRFRNIIASIDLEELRDLCGIVGQTGSTITFPDRCFFQQQLDLEELVELGCRIVRLADKELANVNMLIERELETLPPAPGNDSPKGTVNE